MAPPEMTQINRSDSFRDVPLYANTDYDDDHDDYERWLMEDHPLRSYPSECCPGLFSAKGGRLFGLVCVVVIFTIIIIQSVAIIPPLISYLAPREHAKEDLPLAHWPSQFDTANNPSRCLSYNPRTRADAIQYALAAGCTGAKADLWLHGDDILVGSSFANLDEKSTLQSLYLDPLLTKLSSNDLRSGSGLFRDPAQSFVLLLDVKTSRHAVLPRLVTQLNGLRQKGFLTRMNGSQVAPGPVTVVITGYGGWNRVGLPYHDEIFFDASLDELTLEDYEQPWRLSTRTPWSPHARVPSRSTEKVPSWTPTSAIYSASANFPASIGYPRRGRLSPQQIALIRAQIRAAHKRGIRVRYEGIPPGHERLGEYIWRVLIHEGADIIDVDWQASYQQAWWQRWSLYRPT